MPAIPNAGRLELQRPQRDWGQSASSTLLPGYRGFGVGPPCVLPELADIARTRELPLSPARKKQREKSPYRMTLVCYADNARVALCLQLPSSGRGHADSSRRIAVGDRTHRTFWRN